MNSLTNTQKQLLADGLGLGKWTRKPHRADISGSVAMSADPLDLAALVDGGLLLTKKTHGPAGTINYYVVTDEGKQVAIDYNNEQHPQG